MFKQIILFHKLVPRTAWFTTGFSPASNLPPHRHQTSIPGLHDLRFLWIPALLPWLSPLWYFPALSFALSPLPPAFRWTTRGSFAEVFSASPIFPSHVSASLAHERMPCTGLLTTHPLTRGGMNNSRTPAGAASVRLSTRLLTVMRFFPKLMSWRFHLPR